MVFAKICSCVSGISIGLFKECFKVCVLRFSFLRAVYCFNILFCSSEFFLLEFSRFFFSRVCSEVFRGLS